MCLYEDGKFQLDDPVSKFIPNFPDQIYVSGDKPENIKTKPVEHPATIRNCLTHTAGLGYFFLKTNDPVFKVTDSLSMQYLPQETLGIPGSNMPDHFEAFSKVPLAFEPGSKYRYSISQDVVGHLVTVMSGKALDTFISERILQPLGMTDTAGYHIEEKDMHKAATIYAPSAADQTKLEYVGAHLEAFQNKNMGVAMRAAAGLGGHSGGGNIISSSSDVFKFAMMLGNKGVGTNGARVLKEDTVQLMMQNHLPNEVTLSDPTFNSHIKDKDAGCCLPDTGYGGPGHGYGLGGAVVVDANEASNLVGPIGKGSFGWLGIFKTEYWVDPEHDLVCSYHSQVLWGEFLGIGNKQGAYLTEFRKNFATKVYGAVMELGLN